MVFYLRNKYLPQIIEYCPENVIIWMSELVSAQQLHR
jgi:hypothetical protein